MKAKTVYKSLVLLAILQSIEQVSAVPAKEAPKDDRPLEDRIWAMGIVVVAGAIGGMIIQLI